MINIEIDKEGVVKWAFGIGLFIFLLAFVAMPAVNDALRTYNDSVTRSVAYADSTQQYNKIALNPYNKPSMISGQNSTFTLNVNPPDSIASVLFATINFQVYMSPTVNYTLWVNNRSCNTPSFYVSTTQASAGQGYLSYDCSNIINKAGNYIVTIVGTKDTSAIFGWLDLTYMNNPVANIKYFGGTDYWLGETATVFLQLNDANGQKVNTASCVFDLYNTTNPQGTAIFRNQPMIFQGDDGIYYYQFNTQIAGLREGVYPADAVCTYIFDNFYYWSQSLMNTINWTINVGSWIAGNALVMNFFDDQSYFIVQSVSSGSGRASNVTYRFDNLSTNLTQIDYYWTGEATQSSVGSTTATWYALNKTSNSYNIVLGSLTIPTTTTLTGQTSVFTARVPYDAFQTSNNVSIQMVGISGSTTTQYATDWQTLKAFRNSSYVTQVLGGSEVHIYSANITNAILNGSYYSQQNNAILLQINGTVNQINSTSAAILNSLNTNFTNMFSNLSLIQSNQNTMLGWEQKYFLLWNNTVFVNIQNNQSYMERLLLNNSANLTQILNNLSVVLQNQQNIMNNQSYQNSFLIYWNGTLYPAWTTNFSVINSKLDNVNSTLNTGLTNIYNNLSYIIGFEPKYLAYWNNTLFVGWNSNFSQMLSYLGQINITVNRIDLNVLGVNATVYQVLGLAQEINLTTLQTYQLAQTMNLTTIQTLQLLQAMNVTQNDILILAGQINLTVNDIKTIAGQTNLTVNQLYLLTQYVNLTTSQTLGIAVDMNLTTKQILILAQQINSTVAQNLALLLDINATVHEVNLTAHDIRNMVIETNLTAAQTFAFLQAFNISTTGFLSEINITTHNNALSLQQLLGFANETNLTTQQILSLLQQINTTFEAKLDNINNSANLLVNLTREINSTTHEINITSYQILSAVQGINFSQALGYLAEINATVHYNNLTVQQILSFVTETNLTTHQTYDLLNFINVTFENKLDTINNTVNNVLSTVLSVNGTVSSMNTSVGEILVLSQQMNLTTAQTYSLLQAMNITQADILGYVQQINQTTMQDLFLDGQINQTAYSNYLLLLNLTSAVGNITVDLTPVLGAIQEINQTTLQILGQTTEINLTSNQVLGIVTELNLTTGQIWSLLQFINVTFEQKLDTINNTLNNVTVNVSQLIDLSNAINLTTQQTLSLAQSLNFTQSQMYSLLLNMNQTLYNTFILTNTTSINVGQILQLSQQTNTTVNSILGIVQALNISINQTISGNITLNSNLTAATIQDISEKVWLEFLTLGTPPPMPSTSYYCSDNVTLVKDITFDVCSTAGCKEYTKLTNEFCEFGCDFKNNQCVPSPINRMGFIAVVIVGILGFIVIVRRFA